LSQPIQLTAQVRAATTPYSPEQGPC
jgi:hypothetical protein